MMQTFLTASNKITLDKCFQFKYWTSLIILAYISHNEYGTMEDRMNIMRK
jgi:hypothetical protein